LGLGGFLMAKAINETHQWLAEYARNGSETAFRELVSHYVNLVYSTAVRLVNGDTHLAEDVVQTVFADLARKARRFPANVMLGGWLHRHTCFVASTTRRGEYRRQKREREAIQMQVTEDHSASNLAQVAPVLDEAIEQLNSEDRTAVLLRFFEQQDFRTIGLALGSNEDAARMRVTRALDKLQVLLKERGVVLPAAALGTALAAEAVSAAPAGLAAAVATGALAQSMATSGGAGVMLKLVALGKAKVAIVTALAVGAIATPLVIQREAASTLREENQALRQQVEQLEQTQLDNQQLSNSLAQAQTAPPLAPEQQHELLQLRAEVTKLHQQSGELTKLRQENQQLRSRPVIPAPAVATQPSPAQEELAQLNACVNNLRQIDGAIQQCALEKHLKATNSVTADDLAPYLLGNQIPVCPSGGSYSFGRVDQVPTCTIPGHQLPQ
jgi:RNA polymerase sigma factor (sigma-70 family)